MIATATPTITAGGYSANDQIGGLMTFTVDPGVRKLISVAVTDKSKQKPAMKLFLCKSAPTVPADNAAASITDAHIAEHVIAVVDIPTASYVDLALNSIITVTPNVAVQTTDGKLYAFAMVTGTPTMVSTSDLTFKLGLE
jgi:hypothetical protein